MPKTQPITLLPNPRILVVDDDDQLREFLAETLEAHGLKVARAANGTEGLRTAQMFHPDVILTDIRMPVMRGDEMATEFRHRGFKKPIIFISGHEISGIMLSAVRNRVFDFIEKPFSEEELISSVRRAFDQVWTSQLNDTILLVALQRLSATAEQIAPSQLIFEIEQEARAKMFNRLAL